MNRNDRRRLAEGVTMAARNLLVLSLVLSLGCRGHAPTSDADSVEEISIAGTTMGTSFSIKIVNPPPEFDAQSLATDIDVALERVNNQMSTWRPDSELSRLNNAPVGEPQTVSEELLTILGHAAEISEQSGGAFDVTVGPLVDLWSFGPGGRPKVIPSEADLATAREAVGMSHLQIDPEASTVTRLHAGVRIDLSAIAKGYGVDVVDEVLARHGLTRTMAEIGGEVRCRGTNASNQPWQIGIEHPTPGQRTLYASVPVRDAALATSGNYRNFFEHEGVSYGHTIDPTTGWPTSHALVSASVVTDNCERADAYATAMMALGLDKAFALAERADVGVLLLVRQPDGTLLERRSPAWPAPRWADAAATEERR